MFPKEKLIARYARTFQLAHSINQLLTTSGTFNFTFVRPAGTTSILDVTLVSESSALGAAGGGIGDAFNLGIGTFAVGVPLPPTRPLVLVGLIALVAVQHRRNCIAIVLAWGPVRGDRDAEERPEGLGAVELCLDVRERHGYEMEPLSAETELVIRHACGHRLGDGREAHRQSGDERLG